MKNKLTQIDTKEIDSILEKMFIASYSNLNVLKELDEVINEENINLLFNKKLSEILGFNTIEFINFVIESIESPYYMLGVKISFINPEIVQKFIYPWHWFKFKENLSLIINSFLDLDYCMNSYSNINYVLEINNLSSQDIILTFIPKEGLRYEY